MPLPQESDTIRAALETRLLKFCSLNRHRLSSIVRELSAQFVHLKRATQSDIAQQPRATEEREKAFGLPIQRAPPLLIPVKWLLGQPVHDSLDELKDPYILSTLLRSTNCPKELIKRPQVSQHESLRSIKLSCWSKGQLIHRTQPDGPNQPMSSSEFHELLPSQPCKPLLWRTGLILL
ncbi:hypothetical protein PtA15_1A890 [Puccinia triticina]|uniref:Uncharacterized protein n=1 Tax=Puccinia triticina TaxID=208348 RepID=A0ABY7C8Q6_9BASI|nr:uncharacterized protein PtA15_1A890 [Puccinia triticina]WAQ81548.1 hypothetical protein PtA15_1A890 [Puccinia triticina]